MVKIKLGHEEVEHKLFLEVMGVYVILALVMVGAFYLEPIITGFVTVTKQLNYTDEVNLEFNEDQTYVWTLSNPGNLKSVKIDGSIIGNGEAKVYIENNGIRHLIFDSTQLVEKGSGIFGITGFVVAENKSKGKEPNHPPVWNSSIDSFILGESLTINLNDYFNDKDGDVLTYSASELKTNDLGILLENSILTINNKNNVEGNRTLETIASDNITTKKKNIALVLIKKIVINETLEKIININLDYGDNEFYDVNNNGVERLNGVIDFTIENTGFNWPVDESKLCTRYEIFSAENQESSFACFGSNNCCNFVDLESSRDLWNESLFLSYGGYGSTDNNLIFAQVLHIDYNLSVENPYTDIVYSSWGNLTAEFVSGFIEFEDVCVESCVFDGNASSYNLIIELENTTLRIDSIKYLIEGRVTNNDPILIKEIENISVLENEEFVLDLTEYFSDKDNDELNYDYFEVDDLTIRFEDDLAYIIPNDGFVGNVFTFITANDSISQIVSNVFKIEVKTGKPSIEFLDSEVIGENWTVSFSTKGVGDLVISVINGTHAEMYNDNVSTADDLGILELSCGEFEIFSKDNLIENEDLWFVLANGTRVKLVELLQGSYSIRSVYVEDYECDETGYYTLSKLSFGLNSLEFNFGGEVKVINSDYGILIESFEIRDKDNNKLAVFDSFGNLEIKGNLSQNVSVEFDENDFFIQNQEGDYILVIKNPEGNMDIKGLLNENQSLLVPGPGSFVVQNKNEEIVAYVDSAGSLFLSGTLTESVLLE